MLDPANVLNNDLRKGRSTISINILLICNGDLMTKKIMVKNIEDIETFGTFLIQPNVRTAGVLSFFCNKTKIFAERFKFILEKTEGLISIIKNSIPKDKLRCYENVENYHKTRRT